MADNLQLFEKRFDGLEKVDQKDTQVYIYKWITYAKEELGWSKNLIGGIIASGNKLVDNQGNQEVNSESYVRLKSGKEVCNCNITYDFCYQTEDCKDTSCEERNYCGILLLSKCNGYCVED